MPDLNDLIPIADWLNRFVAPSAALSVFTVGSELVRKAHWQKFTITELLQREAVRANWVWFVVGPAPTEQDQALFEHAMRCLPESLRENFLKS